MDITVWLLVLSIGTFDSDEIIHSRVATYYGDQDCYEAIEPFKELILSMDSAKMKSVNLGCFSKVIRKPI